MRYQSISIDWTGGVPTLHYGTLDSDREDKGEVYSINGFAYLPAALSRAEVTTKFLDFLIKNLREDIGKDNNMLGKLLGLRAAVLEAGMPSTKDSVYFSYQDGQWFGYLANHSAPDIRIGELVCDVDGYWKFFPSGTSGGYIPDYVMKAVLNKLDELNAYMNTEDATNPVSKDVGKHGVPSEEKLNEILEQSFWSFDARRSGYSNWKGKPQSERDAFKGELRNVLADYTEGINSSYFVDNDSRVAAMHEADARIENARARRKHSVVAKAEEVARSQIRSGPLSALGKPVTYEQILEKENRYLKACVAKLEAILFHRASPGEANCCGSDVVQTNAGS